MKLQEFLVPQSPKKKQIWYDKFVATLDAEDKKYFDACLANPAFTATYLSKKITEFGFPVSETAILRYRKSRNL